ncbi:hypothetical protein FACS1894172_16090 [Spirochaetia bacterium]|nr:hypothetical protein FACS1894172_16090 [Spirochaetia bacterium]
MDKKLYGTDPVSKRLELTEKEYRTLIELLHGKSQKEIALEEGVTFAAVSARKTRAIRRNGFGNEKEFFIHFNELLNSQI